MKTFNCDECSKKYNKKQKLYMEKEHNTNMKKQQNMIVEFVVANSQRAEV